MRLRQKYGTVYTAMLAVLLMLLSVSVQAQASEPDWVIIDRDNVQRLQMLSRTQAFTSAITGATFSPDSQALILTGNNTPERMEILAYSVTGQQLVPMEPAFEPYAVSGSGSDILFFNDAENIAVAAHGAVLVWNTQSGDLTIVILQSFASDIANLGAGRLLVSSGESGLLSIWRVPTMIPPQSTEAPPLPEDYTFMPPANLVAATQMDAPVADITHDALHHAIFVLTNTGTLHRYATPAGFAFGDPDILPQPLQDTEPQTIALSGNLIALDPEGQWLAYPGSHQDVIVYDYQHERLLLQYPMNQPVICLIAAPGGDHLIVGENAPEAALIIIDTLTFEEIGRVNTGAPIQNCAYSPDGALMVTTSPHGEVSLWGIE